MNVNKKIVDNKFEIQTTISAEMRDSVSATSNFGVNVFKNIDAIYQQKH